MSNISDDLQRSEQLIKSIGATLLSNGKSVSESLTIDGIPYWDVFAPELARVYLPSALAKINYKKLIIQVIKPIFIKAKYFIRDLTRLYKHHHEYSGKSFSNPILCLDFMPQQSRDVMQPVVRYLADKENKQIVSLRDRAWQFNEDDLNSNEVRRTTWSFWCDDLNTQSLDKELKVIKKSFVKSKVLEQIGVEPYVKKRIQRALNRLFVGEFSSLIRHGVLSKHILKKLRPSLVIAADTSDPRTRIYMLQCKKIGIPCLAIQFGLVSSASIEWRFFPADLVAVWGEESRETLVSHGISSNQIIKTGSPRNDSLFNFPTSEVEAVKNKLGIPEGSPVILLASTFSLKSYDNLYKDPEILQAMIKSVFDSVDHFDNVYLIVKPHPEENENKTKSFVSNNPNIIFVSKTEDIRPLIKICDCFISFNSTTTIDALILDKLVICPAFPGWNWNKIFTDTKAVCAPTSTKEMYDIFKLISASSQLILLSKLKHARDKLVKNWIYRNDGLAGQRIGNLALSMISDHKKKNAFLNKVSDQQEFIEPIIN